MNIATAIASFELQMHAIHKTNSPNKNNLLCSLEKA